MDFQNWKWINESTCQEENGVLKITAYGKTDWYNNPVPQDGILEDPILNASILYTEIEGDFIFRAQIIPNFVDDFDAGALMVIADEKHWVKAAFENTDHGKGSAICGVTSGLTDDANGWLVEQDYLWIQLTRVDDLIAMHFSLDGETYHICRLFKTDMPKLVKVGFEAQSPRGNGGIRLFQNILLERKTVENIRDGK